MYIVSIVRKLILSKEFLCFLLVYVNYMYYLFRFDWEWGLIYRFLFYFIIYFNIDIRYFRFLIFMFFFWIGVVFLLYKLREILLFEDLN